MQHKGDAAGVASSALERFIDYWLQKKTVFYFLTTDSFRTFDEYGKSGPFLRWWPVCGYLMDNLTFGSVACLLLVVSE